LAVISDQLSVITYHLSMISDKFKCEGVQTLVWQEGRSPNSHPYT